MSKRKRLADFEIDKLTNSIENSRTGETFDTEITQLNAKDVKLINKRNWLFDWKTEIKDNTKEVYKLSTVNNPLVIQRLTSIEERRDHIFMHLVESADFNRGKAKIMGLIKEPKNVDLIIRSKPWNEEELAELSDIIQKAKKAKKARAKSKRLNKVKKHTA